MNKEMKNYITGLALAVLVFGGCTGHEPFKVDEHLKYCLAQTKRTLENLPGDTLMPRTIEKDGNSWTLVEIDDWTSGFWPGILWYAYEYSGDEDLRKAADHYTSLLTPLSQRRASNHDLGFQMFCSFGNGLRITGEDKYKNIILRSADTLATLFNPNVGTLLSWPGMVQKMDWPHNTIIDNMLNLEMLFWASANGGDSSLFHIADCHAEVTMRNQFRKDYSSFHVVVYDDKSGEQIGRYTHQGYADETMWARGQAWGIYGFAMAYRETGNRKYLELVQKIADVFLDRLPDDMVPYWDFDAPNIPDEPKDASAAAITASALLELSTYLEDSSSSSRYRLSGEKIIWELSTEKYQSRGKNSAFLLHSTGHYPNGSEVDASIIYADYYYLESLIRLQKLKNGQPLFDKTPTQ